MSLDKSRDHPSLFLGRWSSQLKKQDNQPHERTIILDEGVFCYSVHALNQAEDTLGQPTIVRAPSSCLVLAVGPLISSTGLVMSRYRCCLTVHLWPIPFMVLKAEPASGLLQRSRQTCSMGHIHFNKPFATHPAQFT
jgi:hypothetical protein